MSSDAQASRRWSRFLDIISTRRRRSRSASPSQEQPSSQSHSSSRFNRRSRNRRNPADRRTQYQPIPYLPHPSVRRPPTLSPDEVHEPRTVRESPNTIITNTLAELDPLQDHDILAVVNRIFDEYQATNSTDYPPSSLYFTDVPHTPSRRVMRVHNAYYIANRRPGRHSQLTAELEREFRWNMGHRVQTGGHPPSPFRLAASDDQIEALPTFVMEKGETRSVRDIFVSMKDPDTDADQPNQDECGGLMTSYTECAICLSDFEAGDEITSLPCGHFFHLTGCVREWLRNHARTCPTCRADICASSASSDGLGSQAATTATSVEMV